ncbi:UDP-glucose 4-epimerase GalE [Roseomonas sp. BN140053]|uniref:UDP-glucose 4-epimerase GalE n=1 Tax=Roseomonas sp. BN140053 TaxID=3391898 RepID=UPI0039E90C82
MVLVTGGAGYIGSHAVLALREAGFGVVVLDDLSTGFAASVPDGVPLVKASVLDTARVAETLRTYRISAVMHFAASLVVPESVEQPLHYWRNNLGGTLSLVSACTAVGVSRLVFSSTAAVYGIPDSIPVAETAPCQPINPYGSSKLASERMLGEAGAAHGLNTVVLRYFNVAGADPAGRAGQRTLRATHLLKVACEAALGRRNVVEVYGNDYPTPDGTGLRDYIHVSDLADAHVAALRHLLSGGGSLTLNCGYGRGLSVREVLSAVERVTGSPLPVRYTARRAGDPPALIAQADRIKEVLGWKPVRQDLDGIIRSALAWERKLMIPALETAA